MNLTAIERLEPRIAPAAITITGKTATWTDHDGDLVTMKWSSAEAPTFAKIDKGDGLLVSRILLEAAKHDGASMSITVKKGGVFGDGRIEIGHLDGVDVVLKSWVSPKVGFAELDLGKFNEFSIGTLITGGIGQTKSSDFMGALGNGQSRVTGSVGVVKINGDIGYGGIFFQGQQDHGSITVTGSLRGDLPGGDDFDGQLLVFGGGKSLKVGGNIVNAQLSQQSGGSFKTVTIGGDLVSTSDYFPRNSYASAENLIIRGSIIGAKFGLTDGGDGVKSVMVGGSLVAREDIQGSGELTIGSGTPVKSVTVRGGLYGADFASWGVPFPEFGAGAIHVNGSVGVINVGGSIFGGAVANGVPVVNGGIFVTGNVGAINIGGRIAGTGGAHVYILAGGIASGSGDYAAIGKINIKGDATHAYIAAGTFLTFDNNTKLFSIGNNPDAGIGSVNIGGNFVNSNIFAGVKDGGFFGVGNTPAFESLDTGDPALSPKLGRVVIKGHLLTDGDSTLNSGFAADVIASIVVNGRQIFKAGDGFRNFDTFITAKEL